MRQLYVMSKPFDNKPRLIGVLSEDNGEYEFKYKLGGTFPEWFLQIDEFPYADKVYRGEDVKPFVKRLIPHTDSPYIKGWLKEANLKKYDEWGLLRVFGQRNMHEDAYLYENIPNGAITYEQVEAN